MSILKNIFILTFIYLLTLLPPKLQASEIAMKFYQNGQSDLAQKAFIEYIDKAKSEQRKTANYHQALITLSTILLNNLETEKAINYIEEALKLSPTSADELLLAGDIYCAHAQQISIFRAIGFGKKCAKQYESAAKQFPKNIKTLIKATQFHIYAPSMAGGSTDKAKFYLTQLQKLSEEDARMPHVKYQAEVEGESEAIVLAEKYAQQHYENHKNLYLLASYLKYKVRLEASKKLFAKIVTATTHTLPMQAENAWYETDSWFQLGQIIFKEGKNVSQSIEYLEEYIRRNNDIEDKHFYWARWDLAQAYFAIGRIDDYHKMIAFIKTHDYQKDKMFKEHFLDGIKARKIKQ